ncbi:polysaccharide pyruvyl transferase family protein [Clostridium nigeriense]|uniref:polysaccharide pyruvyl transferase family protein n=1 Tax=Clostridium nigeriense TaxID=1805470 RepID=UPI003D335331
MKIGILTYHDTTNYGAVLQEYALAKTLNEYGCDCEVIQYRCEAVENREKLFNFKNMSVKKIIKFLVLGSSNRRKYNEFKKFTRDNIRESQAIYTKGNIKESAFIYDKFIVGSDQVWNTQLSGNDMTFFLDFCKDSNKKYSYAASFGVSALDGATESNIKELLENFKSITVRENEGSEIIRNLINKEVPVVLDPTFLVDKNEWKQLARTARYKMDKKYILLYLIQDKKSTLEYARKLAEKMSCEIVYINISPYRESGMNNVRDASPYEFLELLKNAQFIITGSYHGVVLSINMNVNFVFEVKSATDNYNSRINTVIKLFNLEHRRINHNTFEYGKIDYEEINRIIEREREKSINILRSFINE